MGSIASDETNVLYNNGKLSTKVTKITKGLKTTLYHVLLLHIRVDKTSLYHVLLVVDVILCQ